MPYTLDDQKTIEELKNKMLEAKIKKILNTQRTPAEENARLEHKMAKRRWEHFKRKARARYVKAVCDEIKTAAEFGDMGEFYATLPKLGVHIFGKSKKGEEPHSLQEVREFLQNLSSNPAPVSQETIER